MSLQSVEAEPAASGAAPLDSAERLLAAYEPGTSAYLGSPRGGLLTTGIRSLVPATAPAELAAIARSVLAATDGELLVGAVGFDPSTPAHLFVPEIVRRSPPDQRRASVASPASLPAGWTVRRRPERGAYETAVAEALRRIHRGDLTKVVLARSLDLIAPAAVDVAAVLRALARRDPRAYPYAVPLPSGTSGELRTFVGASPELLIRRSGSRVVAEPVAGSMVRSADPAEDAAAAKALLASAKDRAEHGYVVESVVSGLGPLCTEVHVPAEPVLISTATMWHLTTRIEGTLRAGASGPATSLDLALALHPTPAVCGTPTAAARAAIDELEGFDRGYYAGTVGWCDRDGDGEWVVAIRCAEIVGAKLRLAAGAGIVAASEPQAELAETSAKLRTLLQAMGLEGDL